MNSFIAFNFILLMSVFVSIDCQSLPHYCEALEANHYKMSFSFSRPNFFDNNFGNWITIRGFGYGIAYTPTQKRNKRKDDSEITSSEDKDRTESKQLVTLSTNGEYVVKGTTFFNQTSYVTAFGITYSENKNIRLFGGLKPDFRSVQWILTQKLGSNYEKQIIKRETRDGKNQLQKRQVLGTTPDPKWIWEFQTGFDKTNYRPHVSFNSMTNIKRNIIALIETKAGNNGGDNINDIQVFEIKNPNYKWENITNRELSKISKSVKSVASKHVIKAIFPIQINSRTNGFIFLFEVRCNDDNPCIGSLTYKYCVAKEDDSTVAEKGNSCDRNNWFLLYNCTKWWQTSGRPTTTSHLTDITETLNTNSEVTDIPLLTSTIESFSTTKPTEESSTSKGGMGWLWILIIIIILLILAIILCLFCFLRKKGSKEAEKNSEDIKPSDAPQSGVGNTMSSLSTVSARSHLHTSDSPKSGISDSSSLSTASNRSKIEQGNATHGTHGKTSTEPKEKDSLKSKSTFTSTVSTRSTTQ